MVSIYQAITEIEKNNDSAALCTVVKSEGSTPRHVGCKMLVYPDGHIVVIVVPDPETWMALLSSYAVRAQDTQAFLIRYM